MGMFDTVVVLDPLARLCCPDGHVLRSFKTKQLVQPGYNAYLVHAGKLYLASSDEPEGDEPETRNWRIETDVAVRERRYRLQEVQAPRTLRVYGSCQLCEPVLVRAEETSVWGDLVSEHALFVDFDLTFRPGEPLQVAQVSGTREALKRELRAGGAYVLEDHDPLANAHRSLRLARARVSVRAAEGIW